MVLSVRMVSGSGLAGLSGAAGSLYLSDSGCALCGAVSSGTEGRQDAGRAGTDHIRGRMDGDHH